MTREEQIALLEGVKERQEEVVARWLGVTERITALEATLREWIAFGERMSDKPQEAWSDDSLVTRSRKLLG